MQVSRGDDLVSLTVGADDDFDETHFEVGLMTSES